jgi:predicted RNase H-like HicB family nuclease
VPEAGGWSVFIPGLPVAADGRTLDEALAEMVDALREYAEDRHGHLRNAPDHRQHQGLVELINISDDARLRHVLLGN